MGEFEQGVDAALGDRAGSRVSAVFRFIQGHPDDRNFVSLAFTYTPGRKRFRPTSVDTWVKPHSDVFEALTPQPVSVLHCSGTASYLSVRRRRSVQR